MTRADPGWQHSADEAEIARRLRDLALADIAAGRAPAPYLRQYLVEHALAGDVLDAEHVPNPVLPHLELSMVMESLSRHRVLGDGLPALPVLRQVAHRWRDDAPEFNAGLLDMWAALRTQPLDPLVGTWWEVVRAAGPVEDSTVIGQHDSDVWAVAVPAADEPGDLLVATAGGDGTVRVWNLRTGARVRLWQAHRKSVTGLHMRRLPGVGQVVISAGEDGIVHVLPLESELPVASTPLELAHPVRALTVVDTADGPLVVTADAEGVLRCRSLGPRGRLGEARLVGEHGSRVEALVVMVLPGGPVCLSGALDGTLQAWDVVRREPLGGRVEHGNRPIRSLAVCELRTGEKLAVSGGRDKVMRFWTLAPDGTPTPWGGTVRVPGFVDALVAVPAGRTRPTLMAVGFGGRLGMWDVEAATWAGEPRSVPEGSIAALAVTTIDGQPTLITGDRADTVRRWTVASTAEAVEGPRSGVVETLAVGTWPDGRAVVISTADRGGLYEWAAATSPVWGATAIDQSVNGVLAIAVCPGPGGVPVVLAAGFDGRIHRIRLGARPGPAGAPQAGHRAPVVDMVPLVLDGTSAVATAGWDGTVRVWDVATGDPLRAPITLATTDVRAMTIATAPDGTPVAVCGGDDGLLERWDLARGERFRPASRLRERRIARLACTAVGDERIIIVGDHTGAVGCGRLTGDDARFDPRPTVPGEVVALTSISAGGRSLIAVAGGEPFVRIVDLAGAAVGPILPTAGPVMALVARPDDPATLLVGGAGVAEVRFHDRTAGSGSP